MTDRDATRLLVTALTGGRSGQITVRYGVSHPAGEVHSPTQPTGTLLGLLEHLTRKHGQAALGVTPPAGSGEHGHLRALLVTVDGPEQQRRLAAHHPLPGLVLAAGGRRWALWPLRDPGLSAEQAWFAYRRLATSIGGPAPHDLFVPVPGSTVDGSLVTCTRFEPVVFDSQQVLAPALPLAA